MGRRLASTLRSAPGGLLAGPDADAAATFFAAVLRARSTALMGAALMDEGMARSVQCQRDAGVLGPG
jgi:hypothetical protein